MAIFSRTSERLKHLRKTSGGFAGGAAEQGSGPAVQPGSRDMRAQAVHRLQVGMFGLAALAYVIAYIFGKRVAQIVIGGIFSVGVVFFAYVMYRVVMGTI